MAKEHAMAAMKLVEEHARPQEAMLLIRNSIIPRFDFLRRMLPLTNGVTPNIFCG